MQTLDSKLKTLYDNYYDCENAATATKDVEALRKQADFIGLLVTIGAFSLNEVARLTLRSRKFVCL